MLRSDLLQLKQLTRRASARAHGPPFSYAVVVNDHHRQEAKRLGTSPSPSSPPASLLLRLPGRCSRPATGGGSQARFELPLLLL
jgi:hypothetical protein